jgi:hypothetical protein
MEDIAKCDSLSAFLVDFQNGQTFVLAFFIFPCFDDLWYK